MAPRRVGNIDSCTDETELEDDEDVDELDPSEDEEARPRKKQKKRPSDVEEDPPDLEVTAYIFIIIPPPPTAHVRGKSAKPPVYQHRKDLLSYSTSIFRTRISFPKSRVQPHATLMLLPG
jgi:hypothetical protein